VREVAPADRGRGFRRSDIPLPRAGGAGGRGLWLVEPLADSVVFEPAPGGGTLVRARTPYGRYSSAPPSRGRAPLAAGSHPTPGPGPAPEPQLLRPLAHEQAHRRRLADAEGARDLRQQRHAVVIVVDQEPARKESAGRSALGSALLFHNIIMMSKKYFVNLAFLI
jgi:hypothetical protein